MMYCQLVDPVCRELAFMETWVHPHLSEKALIDQHHTQGLEIDGSSQCEEILLESKVLLHEGSPLDYVAAELFDWYDD